MAGNLQQYRMAPGCCHIAKSAINCNWNLWLKTPESLLPLSSLSCVAGEHHQDKNEKKQELTSFFIMKTTVKVRLFTAPRIEYSIHKYYICFYWSSSSLLQTQTWKVCNLDFSQPLLLTELFKGLLETTTQKLKLGNLAIYLCSYTALYLSPLNLNSIH